MFLSIMILKSFGEDEYKTEVLKGIDFEIEKVRFVFYLGLQVLENQHLVNIEELINQIVGTITIPR